MGKQGRMQTNSIGHLNLLSTTRDRGNEFRIAPKNDGCKGERRNVGLLQAKVVSPNDYE